MFRLIENPAPVPLPWHVVDVATGGVDFFLKCDTLETALAVWRDATFRDGCWLEVVNDPAGREGAAAYYAGRPLTDCPHPRYRATLRRLWLAGWREARDTDNRDRTGAL